MTLPYSPSRAVYQGNGAATAFPFAFKVWNTDQLSVSLTSPDGRTTAAQGWTASLGESGGTLTYLHNGAPLPDGWWLAIVRDMPFAQGIDLVSASRFDPQVIEDGLDQATAELQQLNEKITRAVILPATSAQSPEDVVLAIYASRDAAEASANAASAQASAAAGSADAAASSADAAEASALAAAQSAASAEGASNGLAPRMNAAEQKNAQQDTRLDAVESGVTAISTTLIGSVQSVMATESYVPNGCVPANGAEYTRAQFPTLYDAYLAGGKLLTCTYAAWTAQVGITGNCAKFALDSDAQKFKVPLLKDGDSITQAASAAEHGKSYKAGLPNVKGEFTSFDTDSYAYGLVRSNAVLTAPFYKGTTLQSGNISGRTYASYGLGIDLSLSNAIYGNSTTVTDEQVRLRHFVVVASAQNGASVFDWSAYMAALAGKANVDLSNVTGNAIGIYAYFRDEKTAGTSGGSTSATTWQTRDLNTTVKNLIPEASLAGNGVTLPAGRYYIRASVPVYVGVYSRAALYDRTHSTYLLYSPSCFTSSAGSGFCLQPFEDEITLTSETTLELRMWVTAANAAGMGINTAPSGVKEIYSEIRIWKL